MSSNTANLANFRPAKHAMHQVTKKNPHDYDDIIDLSYPFSPTTKPITKPATRHTIQSSTQSAQSPRKRLTMGVRAAEFAPFAALTGYNEVIDEVEKSNNDTSLRIDDAELSVEC